MSYMKRGPHDKSGDGTNRGHEDPGTHGPAIHKANSIEFVEPKGAGGDHGAAAKNHWDGSGAKGNSPTGPNGGGHGRSQGDGTDFYGGA